MKPINHVDYVDIERFMGDWYVIANIPTFIEKKAFNAVESYSQNDDGTIATVFTFNKGSVDGEQKKYTPTGFVLDDPSNALWDMQFVWPFKSDYRIVYLDSDYTVTAIGRQKRDYVWIMARTPSIDDQTYSKIVDYLVDQGYERNKIQLVPQNWPNKQSG
ncbi:MAG: outer membrane lipoprotein [Lysobacteraceae bacterium]|nr:MAG: outer membrane lipoprotein [Xanthomonadaceae bacterium]